MTRKQTFALAATLVVVGGALLFLFGPDAYQAAKVWRSRQLASQVDELLEQEKWVEAEQRALAALQLAPTEIEAQRTWARLLTLRNHPSALGAWTVVLRREERTADDWQGFFTVAIRRGDLKGAIAAVEGMRQDSPDNEDKVEQLVVTLLDMVGKEGKAAEMARKHLLESENTAEGFALYAAQLLSQQLGSEEDQEVARRTLWKLVEQEGDRGIQAAIILSRMGGHTEEELAKLVKRIRGGPAPPLELEIVAMATEASASGGMDSKVFKDWIEDAKERPVADRRLIAAWLSQAERHDLALSLFSEEEAFSRRDVFLVYIQALAGMGRWESIKELLGRSGVPLRDSMKHLLLARAAKFTGNEGDIAYNWNQAFLAARVAPPELAFMAEFAAAEGWNARAREALTALMRHPGGTLPALQGLYELESRVGTARDVLRVVNQMLDSLPSAPDRRNEKAHLQALLSENLDEAEATARELIKENPQYKPARYTLALVLFRKSQTGAAWKSLNEDGQWRPTNIREAAILSALLTAIGREEDAREAARRINAAKLLPEERDLLPDLDEPNAVDGPSPSEGEARANGAPAQE